MTPEEKVRLIDIIAATAELLNRQMSRVAVEVYIRAVEDLEFKAVSQAFSTCIRTSRFFPTPSDIREAVLGPPEKVEDVAMVECSKALGAIKRHGAYRSIVFDDPVTMAVLQQHFGGWERACDVTEAEEKFWSKDFVRAYCAFARTGLRSYGVLSGATERHNNARGYAIEAPPVLIGDREKAIAVWRHEREEKELPAPKGKIKRLLEMVGNG